MNQHIFSGQVPYESTGERIDLVLSKMFPDFSRSRIQQSIKQGEVSLDNVTVLKAKQMVVGGEAVTWQLTVEPATELVAQDIPLDIVYEDEALLVINKPAGLVVHPGAGNPDGTLMNALLHYLPGIRDVPRAGIVHRLDKDTSGLMVVAKTLAAQTHLVEQLQRHAVQRIYDAVLVGNLWQGGKVDQPIGRSPKDRKKMAVREMGGKKAISHYRVLEHFRAHTRVRVKLETGRTHQIRVHMAHLGFPLVGDPVYGARFKVPKKMQPDYVDFLRHFNRQALHAGALSLTHPLSGKTMKWKAPMPDDLFALLDVLREDLEDYQGSQNDYDDYDDNHGVEVEWVSDEDIPD